MLLYADVPSSYAFCRLTTTPLKVGRIVHHQVHFCVLFATRVDRGSTGCSTHLINRCVPEPLLGTAQPFEEAEWFRIVVTSTLCEWRDGQNVEVTDDEGDEVHSLCCVLL